MAHSFTRGFKSPDEVRKFKAHGQMELLKFGDAATIGRGVFEPGWKWSNDVKPGDAFHIPPGHDAWTEGSEPCVLIDVTGVKNHAKPA